MAAKPSTPILLPGDGSWPFPFSREEWDQVPPAVQAYILMLQKRLDQLEARLNRTSRNSNQPPSADSPFQRRKKSSGKGKPGAKKGHKGKRQAFLPPTSIIDVPPESCSCGGTKFGETTTYYTHQHIELPEIQPDVTHFHLQQGTCASCRQIVQAQMDQIPPSQQPGFGPRVTAFVAFLCGALGVSRRNASKLLCEVMGIPTSLGGIQKMIRRAAYAVEPHYNTIAAAARSAAVNHIDETSWRTRTALRWLWVMASRTVVFFKILPGRSKKDFLALVDTWKGILISDDYGLYRNWVNLRQTCLAHLIRRAEKLAEHKDPAIALFGRRIRVELKLACRMARPGHGPPTVGQWQTHYMRVVNLIYSHNERRDEAGIFARALLRQLDSLWVFLEVHGVEPTNNRAERPLRFPVILRRHGQGTKSESGERWVERILSLRETCRIQDRRVFPALVDAIVCFLSRRPPDLSWIP